MIGAKQPRVAVLGRGAATSPLRSAQVPRGGSCDGRPVEIFGAESPRCPHLFSTGTRPSNIMIMVTAEVENGHVKEGSHCPSEIVTKLSSRAFARHSITEVDQNRWKIHQASWPGSPEERSRLLFARFPPLKSGGSIEATARMSVLAFSDGTRVEIFDGRRYAAYARSGPSA